MQLFNKTGASQALVLGENVEKFKQLSQELTQSDRLFIANAKQMATTQGQLDLLASAYDKFSTSLGEAITKTDIFISLIAVFDREVAGQASAYRILANATDEVREDLDLLTESQMNYNKTSENTLTELEIVEKAFDTLGNTVDITRDEFLRKYNEELEKTAKNLEEYIKDMPEQKGLMSPPKPQKEEEV